MITRTTSVFLYSIVFDASFHGLVPQGKRVNSTLIEIGGNNFQWITFKVGNNRQRSLINDVKSLVCKTMQYSVAVSWAWKNCTVNAQHTSNTRRKMKRKRINCWIKNHTVHCADCLLFSQGFLLSLKIRQEKNSFFEIKADTMEKGHVMEFKYVQ